jgi:hypothetical protein
MDWLLYLLAVMVFYDFSLHVFDLLHVYKITTISHPLGAYKIFNYFSKGDELKRKKVIKFFGIFIGVQLL